jgi:hypothetical protein
VYGLVIQKDANMLTSNLLETIHHIWGQQFGKKFKDLFDATIDDLIKVG